MAAGYNGNKMNNGNTEKDNVNEGSRKNRPLAGDKPVRAELIIRRPASAGEDGKPAVFTMDIEPSMTVLDALEIIRSKQAPNLMYRHSCHHGSCGTCGMVINGEYKLACLTRFQDFMKVKTNDQNDEYKVVTVTLAPLPGPLFIGDIAVEPWSFFKDFPRDSSYLRKSELNTNSIPPEEITGPRHSPGFEVSPGVEDSHGFERFENCIECGLCTSACPVTGNFMGPAALAAYNRDIANLGEKSQEEDTGSMINSRLKCAHGERGVWECIRALECSRVCPGKVYPAKHIAILRKNKPAD